MNGNTLNKIFNTLTDVFINSFIKVIDTNSDLILEGNNFSDLPGLDSLKFNYTGERNVNEVTLNNVVFDIISFPIEKICQIYLIIPSDPMVNSYSISDIAVDITYEYLQTAKPSKEVQNISLLLSQIIHAKKGMDISYPALLAANLGYDLSIPRVLLLLHLQLNEKNDQIYHYLQKIISAIKNQNFYQSEDIIGNIDSTTIIYCGATPSANNLAFYERINKLYEFIHKEYDRDVVVTIGSWVDHIEDYGISYKNAMRLYDYYTQMPTKWNDIKKIYTSRDFLYCFLLNSVDPSILDHFFVSKLDILAENKTMVETITALIDNNFNMKDSADKLYIHRNTMVFRIKQIKTVLNLNPLHNDNDRFQLILLYYYYKMGKQSV